MTCQHPPQQQQHNSHSHSLQLSYSMSVSASPRKTRNIFRDKQDAQKALSIVGVVTILLSLAFVQKRNGEDNLLTDLLLETTSTSPTSLATRSMVRQLNNATYMYSYQRKNMDGVDVLMQTPQSTQGPPKGLLFLGHGCHNKNLMFFPPTPDVCPECVGMPEELAIVKLVVEEFQLAVAAISSKKACWAKKDGKRVAPILKQIAQSLSTDPSIELPILAFGSSVGGSFVGTRLLEAMEEIQRPIAGLIAQIPEPPPDAKSHPNTTVVYINMGRDSGRIRTTRRIIKGMRVNHKVKHIISSPMPVTDSFLHDRIQGISMQQSTAIAQALLDAHWLDQSRFLVREPKFDKGWVQYVRPYAPEWDTLEFRKSPIREVLTVAYCFHQIAREGIGEAIEFILGTSTTKSSSVDGIVTEQ